LVLCRVYLDQVLKFVVIDVVWGESVSKRNVTSPHCFNGRDSVEPS
jgi:hypothetical protein